MTEIKLDYNRAIQIKKHYIIVEHIELQKAFKYSYKVVDVKTRIDQFNNLVYELIFDIEIVNA